MARLPTGCVFVRLSAFLIAALGIGVSMRILMEQVVSTDTAYAHKEH